MAMFENFPYTDLHNLNLDWIIKIAKDFLDQYTHIQQLIADGEISLQNLTESGLQQLGEETDNGLQQLQDKADNIEALLNAWYNSHSQDIADQLADALQDLNDWYTTHQAFLDAYVSNAINTFNATAREIASEVIETIPSDYSHVAQAVDEISENTRNIITGVVRGQAISSTPGNIFTNSAYMLSYAPCESGKYYSVISEGGNIVGFTTDVPANGVAVQGNANLSSNVYIQAPITGYIVLRSLNGSSIALIQEGIQPQSYIPTITGIDYLSREINDNLFYREKLDWNYSDPDGYPKGFSGVQSYMELNNSDNSCPVFPAPFWTWHPVDSLTGAYKYCDMPVNIDNSAWHPFGVYYVSFWIKTPETTDDNVKLSAYPTTLFGALTSGELAVNSSRVVNDIQLDIDAHNYNWHHVTMTIPYNAGVTDILIGATYFDNTHKMRFTTPIITKTKPSRHLKYENVTYNNDPLLLSSINVIGDSIARGNGWGWFEMISRKHNMPLEILAVNGARITNDETVGVYSIYQHINDFENRTPKYFIFDGGANDHFGHEPLGTFNPDRFDINEYPATFTDSLETMIKNISNLYPTAKIGYIIPYNMVAYNSNIDVYDQIAKEYFDRAKAVCEKWGVPVLDLRLKTPINYYLTDYRRYFSDEVHINRTGYKFTMNIVEEWLKTL